MPIPPALAALSLVLASSAGGTSCPAAVGDGITDDWSALRACLTSEDDVDPEATKVVQLSRGRTYVISKTLYLTKSKRIIGGVSAQGQPSTIRCSIVQVGMHVDGDLEIRGVHIDGCFSALAIWGNLTLVESTITNTRVGITLAGSRGCEATVFMRRSRILAPSLYGISISYFSRVVVADSVITQSGRSGVVLEKASQEVSLEFHSSVIRDSLASAIEVRQSFGENVSVQLAKQSSLRNCAGPCISLKRGTSRTVTIAGGSWVQSSGNFGVQLIGGKSHEVVVKEGSSIRGSHTGIAMESGVRHNVVVESGSSIQGSAWNGVDVRQGTEHSIVVRGRSWIEGSGASGIAVEGGDGHLVVLAGGCELRNSSRYGVLLAAEDPTLRLENATIRGSGISAVHIRPAIFWSSSIRTASCTTVSLDDAYIVRNHKGFWCQRTCAQGNISGILYLNHRNFDNHCTGELSHAGPLSSTPEFHTLRTAVRWCTLGMAVGVASVPWLVWVVRQHRPLQRSLDRSRDRSLLLVMVAVAVLLTPIVRVWAKRMLDLSHIMLHLRLEDLREVRLLFALSVTLLCVCPAASLLVSRWWLRRWRETKIQSLLRELEEALWQGDSEAEHSARVRLQSQGLLSAEIRENVQHLRRQQSQEAGVSLAYLISSDFLQLARRRTGLENPTFLQMKDPFWSGEDAIGFGVLCPRDGRPGCALVDTLPPQHRQRCTHFLSWVWRYPVLLVREALQIWADEEGLDPSETFLFMCFFVNNQFRILIEGTQAGSDDLETTFEQNLRRIGRVVALLDTWEEPLYLARIWTIYEQYMAAKLKLPVTVILNRRAGAALIAELDKGKEGIFRITDTFCSVRAERAEASVKSDEEHVKAMIRSTVGFEYVNKRVRQSLVNWVALVLRRHMDHLVHNPRTAGCDDLLHRVSCVKLEEAAVSALEVEEDDT